MRYVAWTSDCGLTVVFDGKGPHAGGGPFFFRDLTDSLGATAETVKAPRQDGSTTYHTALDGRSVTLSGSMLVFGDPAHPAVGQYDKKRAYLAEAFSPNRWGTLIYYREDGAVQLRCRPVAAPVISPPTLTYSTVDIDFVSDSPFWLSAKEYVVSLGAILRFRHFPWAPVLGPMGAFNRYAMIENPSKEGIYPTAEIYTTGQYVTLTNRTTGEFATIEHPVLEGQKLVVDLMDVSATLWTRDEAGDYSQPEDVSHWLSLDSQPWAIQPGSNQIIITNDVPEDTPLTFLRYRVPSLGV